MSSERSYNPEEVRWAPESDSKSSSLEDVLLVEEERSSFWRFLLAIPMATTFERILRCRSAVVAMEAQDRGGELIKEGVIIPVNESDMEFDDPVEPSLLEDSFDSEDLPDLGGLGGGALF